MSGEVKERNFTLKYSEIIRDYPSFNLIDPYETRIKQKKKYDGLTIVAFLGNETSALLKRLIEEIQGLKGTFIPVEHLHVTFFGLFPHKISTDDDREIYLEPEYEQFSKEKVSEFFKLKLQNGFEIKFQLKLKHVRPGNSGTTGTSDGTVVAIGDLESEQNRRFVDFAEELGAYLNEKFPSEFQTGFNFKRPFSTIWCTLGYYDCESFPVNREFYNLFSKWNPSEPATLDNISELQLVKYEHKSLECHKLPVLRIPYDFQTVS
jgi:hypothetical protein